MIGDGLLSLVASLIDSLTSALPAAASHTWLDAISPASSLLSSAWGFDAVLPLHEALAVLAITVALSVPMFGFRVAVFIYRLMPFKGT